MLAKTVAVWMLAGIILFVWGLLTSTDPDERLAHRAPATAWRNGLLCGVLATGLLVLLVLALHFDWSTWYWGFPDPAIRFLVISCGVLCAGPVLAGLLAAFSYLSDISTPWGADVDF